MISVQVYPVDTVLNRGKRKNIGNTVLEQYSIIVLRLRTHDLTMETVNLTVPEPEQTPLSSVSLTADSLRHWGLSCVVSGPGVAVGSAAVDDRANGLAFSDSGRILVSSHNDGTLRVINGETGETGGLLRMKDHGCKLVTATHQEHCYLHAAQQKPSEDHVGTIAYHSLHDNSIIRYFRAHTQRFVVGVERRWLAMLACIVVLQRRIGHKPNCFALVHRFPPLAASRRFLCAPQVTLS
jgi:hypothetical protein